MKLPNVLWVVEYVTEVTDGADAEHAQVVFAVNAEDSLKMPEALLLKVAEASSLEVALARSQGDVERNARAFTAGGTPGRGGSSRPRTPAC